MRYSKADWAELNKELAEIHPSLGARTLDARIGGIRMVKYHVGNSGPYENFSPVLSTRLEVDAFMSGLRKGAEMREAAIRKAIGQLFHERKSESDDWLIAMLTTWLP